MKAMKTYLLQAVFCLAIGLGAASQCRHPPAAAGFTNSKYSGVWYEIGRVSFERADYLLYSWAVL